MEWTLGVGLISILVVLVVVLCVVLWRQTGEQWHPRQAMLRKRIKQRRQQVDVDSKIALKVDHLYEHYGEEWINNAGKARLALAIDEMLGPVLPKNPNAVRAHRTLAAAVLEAVIARKGETIRQRQSVRRVESQEGPQVEMYIDVPLAEHPAATENVHTENEDYTNDTDDVDDVEDIDIDDIDDVDDVDLDIN